MVIETQLSQEQFLRLSVLRHLQRPNFYVYAILCAGVTAYAIVQNRYSFILLGSLPFVVYILLGVVSAYRASRVKDAPYFLPTKYEFTERGVSISTPQGQSQLTWDQIESWKQLVNCYVLVLTGGAILAIPRESIPPHRAERFEQLLRKHITR